MYKVKVEGGLYPRSLGQSFPRIVIHCKYGGLLGNRRPPGNYTNVVRARRPTTTPRQRRSLRIPVTPKVQSV